MAMSATTAMTVYIRWRAMVRGPGLSKRRLALIGGPVARSCDSPTSLQPVRPEGDDLDEKHEDQGETDEDADPLGREVFGEQPHSRERLGDTEDTGDGGVLQQGYLHAGQRRHRRP